MTQKLRGSFLFSTLLACGVASGCSALNQPADACTTNEECEEVFGKNTKCDTDGFCVQPEPLNVGDVCSQSNMPLLVSSAETVRVDTSGLTDQVRQLASCTEFETRGNDGFFAVDMRAGEKWHIHANVVGDFSNPALYVLRSCDERTCQVGDAIDECSNGYDEHLSFTAPTTARYIVGLDSRNSGGEKYDVLALAPQCGNGALEHSETCDDNNAIAGDGCDPLCRAELTIARKIEVEPNDDYSSANVILPTLPADVVTVTGRLGGRCDFDTYAINVPQGGSVVATMLDQGGQACTIAPEFKMVLLSPTGTQPIGSQLTNDGSCPSISDANAFASNLEGGMHFVRISTDASSSPFDYRVELQVVPPSA